MSNSYSLVGSPNDHRRRTILILQCPKLKKKLRGRRAWEPLGREFFKTHLHQRFSSRAMRTKRREVNNFAADEQKAESGRCIARAWHFFEANRVKGGSRPEMVFALPLSHSLTESRCARAKNSSFLLSWVAAEEWNIPFSCWQASLSAGEQRTPQDHVCAPGFSQRLIHFCEWSSSAYRAWLAF